MANSLIRHNVNRAPNKKPLVSVIDSSRSGAIRAYRCADCAAEMSWVAADIRDRGAAPESCTVLARSTKLVRAAAVALSEAGLPSYVVRRKAEFESPLMRFLHSALRLAERPTSAEQLALLCGAYHALTAALVQPADAAAESSFEGDSLLAGFVSAAAANADPGSRTLLRTLRDDLLDRTRYGEFIKNVLEWRDNPRRAAGDDLDEEAEERSVWRSLTREIRHHLGADPPLGQFLQQIDLRQKTRPPRATDVQCLTIHLAKGKEFRHVYLTGLAEEQLPSYRAVQGGPNALEEERRNCFVAITRVQSSLTLTYADSYFGWPKRPSRFLAEMGFGGT